MPDKPTLRELHERVAEQHKLVLEKCREWPAAARDELEQVMREAETDLQLRTLEALQPLAEIGARVRAGGRKAARATNTPRREQWQKMQAFIDAEAARESEVTWPELQRRAARRFHVDERTIRRHCKAPRK